MVKSSNYTAVQIASLVVTINGVGFVLGRINNLQKGVLYIIVLTKRVE